MEPAQGLYDPLNERDSCGVGFVVNMDGSQTHEIVERGIEVLCNLMHRGGGDPETGDGAGIMLQVPDAFLRRECASLRIELPPPGEYGVGMLFLPRDVALAAECRSIVESACIGAGMRFLGWRDVPVDSTALGAKARESQPQIVQCFVGAAGLSAPSLERKLYVTRRETERRVREIIGADGGFYIPSMSSRTIVYKGLLMGTQLAGFYSDLGVSAFHSALAVVHQRYSTNTFPSWRLAQPFRCLAHNGEINTLRGNLNQMRAREPHLASPLLGDDIRKVLPVADTGDSDSACLDAVLELLVAGGRDLPHALMMLIPQAWGPKYPIGEDLRGFFEYHAGIMEPWDGPAALAFTDGTSVGAMLDRNGLRPARYAVTRSGFVVLASEAGLLDLPPGEVVERGSLRPGTMMVVDLRRRRILRDTEIKARYARAQPYRRWVSENRIDLHGFFNDIDPVGTVDHKALLRLQRLFGYTREDLDLIVGPMAAGGHEPVGSMGYDAPLAALSEKPQLLYSYFKQLFAQVTNPAIDPIREELVMSLMTFMGNPPNVLADDPANARLIKLKHPIISNEDLELVKSKEVRGFHAAVLHMCFPAGGDQYVMEESLERLCNEASSAAERSKALLVLSDRNLPAGTAPLPALLAVAAVNQRLVRDGVRTETSIIVETGEAREVHHMALLLGYGATAINPYLAFLTAASLAREGALDVDLGVTDALVNYIDSLCRGLLKIMSKMGISTLRSYRGAQVFQAVGLNRALVAKYFPGTSSPVGGAGMERICADARTRHEAANAPAAAAEPPVLASGGCYRYRRDGERHLWTPESISSLQQAAARNDAGLYRQYARLINEQAERQSTLRGLWRLKAAATPVPIEEVEPAAEIVKRFVTSAMSFGSISREAHETLAIAMNRLGAMSNSGEGGEDPARYRPLPNGDSRSSAVKQVASGRFGVTIEYLVNARELQIKIAQGAKPGEGGQLPGHKVNEEIARVRNSTPGVTLISPPPHHDIYSIEDIKQLIFDLRNANPAARISVKLVAEAGVGAVAAGVAKGNADVILISGHDGGTGAAPLSSIRHAGAPWELGLAEVQQTLVLNGLRRRVRLQTDGQLKTGRDVVFAALLGAEEFGFATAPLVVCGCVMMRQCHRNTCAAGVATQDPELRRRFSGRPEHVANFFMLLAGEVRELMAVLGFRGMDEMIGRTDLIEVNEAVRGPAAGLLDFSAVLRPGPAFAAAVAAGDARFRTAQDKGLAGVPDRTLVERAQPAIEGGRRIEVSMPIRNIDRAVGTMLSGAIASRHGAAGLPDDTIVCKFTGSAGQSFGAFGAKGLTLLLEGEANDYLGKGLSGARIVVKPPRDAGYDPGRNIICGNVLLYGATSGEVYIHGTVGERFCVRNSGAIAVVEGVGDHGCEYMTGGRVAVLGATGVNFAAGMSGGIAYVYDPDGTFDRRCNLEMVDIEPLGDPTDAAELRELLERHSRFTGSPRARRMLADWEASLPYFVKVLPLEYRTVLGRMNRADAATQREERRPE